MTAQGTCVGCGRRFSIRRDGRVRYHSDWATGAACSGARELPAMPAPPPAPRPVVVMRGFIGVRITTDALRRLSPDQVRAVFYGVGLLAGGAR